MGSIMSLVRINDVFERIPVLDLRRLPERLAAGGARPRRFDIQFERFPAIDRQRPGIARKWQVYMRQALIRAPIDGRPVISYRELYLDYDSERARVAFVEGAHGRKPPRSFDIGALHTIKRLFDDRRFTMILDLAIQDAADSDIGMSTIFFQEARRNHNVYRWHCRTTASAPSMRQGSTRQRKSW